ncbi:MAG: SGNH/GDSL hydrolase family protein [Pirellulales bacterium]
MKSYILLAAAASMALAPCCAQGGEPTPAELLNQAKRVVFLGDSITAAGLYVAGLDAWLLTRTGQPAPHLICVGLPSETVSGLSEDGHAGGQFPRPDLAERLSRVLNETRPDLVIACYGINCGIYEPFDEGRLERFQKGVRRLKESVELAGAQLIMVTPPFYDDQRAPKEFSYNEVLDRYSHWLLEQRKAGWRVIDLHSAMSAEVRTRRQSDAKFTFQPDGVHPNEAGHWFVAQQLIRAFGDEQAAQAATPQQMLQDARLPLEIWPLVVQRVNVLRDAYVSAAGHKRPGVAAGLPVADAEKQAAELAARIAKLAKQ